MRLGDLDALKETIINFCGNCSNNITEYDENHIPNGNCAIWHILNMIDNAPTVEPHYLSDLPDEIIKSLQTVAIDVSDGFVVFERKRPKGDWIDTGSGQECNKCHEIQYGYDSFRHFCPNCGAEMQKGGVGQICEENKEEEIKNRLTCLDEIIAYMKDDNVTWRDVSDDVIIDILKKYNLYDKD